MWSLTGGQYDPTPAHIRYLSEKLARAATGRLGKRRLLIQEPPRHGKSWLVSHAFPVWYLSQYPDRRVILAAHTTEFASLWGGRVRNTLEEHADYLGVHIARDSSAKHSWDTTAGGGMFSCGVGATPVGRGANVIVVDDPVADMAAACSETQRDAMWEWWTTTMMSRQEPGCVLILMHQRWHEDDLAGRVLANERDEWDVVCLPALAEDNDPLGRKPGAPLWPDRFGVEFFEEYRRLNGSRAFAALYQQRPAPDEGNTILRKWIRYFKPEDLRAADTMFVTSWDLNAKETTDGSFTVGQVWARRPGFRHFYLLDEVRARVGFTDALRMVKAMRDKWPKARTTLIEEKASGIAVIDTLKREGVPGIVAIQVDGKSGSKVARLQAVSPLYEAGDVHYPEGAPWVQDHITELCQFPLAPHDDRVDAASQALSWFVKHGTGSGVVAPRGEPERRASHWDDMRPAFRPW